jgi:gluconolactonase
MRFLFIAFFGPISICFSQIYVAKDFTAENLFSSNIEGPNIDSKGNFFIVNFQKDGTIGLVHEDGTVELFVTLPEGSIGNAIMFDKKENLLVADFKGHNILKIDGTTKAISVYSHDEFNQPNDFCINRSDQLFVSDPNWKEGTGKIWRVNPDGKATLLISHMGTTNGIELSPDEKILYVNESVQRKIWAFDVDKSSGIKNKRLFTEFEDFGLDGMKCDAEGNLYVTRYGKGVIAIFNKDAKLIREVTMTGKKTSNLTFGGTDGKTVYVTLQDRKCVETFRSEIAGKKK